MPESDLNLLIEAAQVAGEIAGKYWRSSPQTWEKPDGAGPVTEADLAIDKMLNEKLMAARPDYGWLSEETEDNTARLAADRVFITDPIDGTRAFMAGEKSFSHALAIAEKGQVTAAVVFLPMANRLYTAELGKGAFLNGEPIHPSTCDNPDGARILSASHALKPEYWPKGVPPVDRHFRSSLAYRIARVADGSFDATFTFRPCWEWDIAAGSLIATEAGACVTDTVGQAIKFNAPHPKAPGLLVAPMKLHSEFLTCCRP